MMQQPLQKLETQKIVCYLQVFNLQKFPTAENTYCTVINSTVN